MIEKYFHKWYNRSDVKFKLIKYLYNREFAMLKSKFNNSAFSIRDLRVHNTQHLDFMLGRFKAFQKNRYYNLYYSLARYKEGIPKQDLSFDPETGKFNRDVSDWRNNFESQIIEYDFLLDIDAGVHKDMGFAHDTVEYIIRDFNVYKVPYKLRFSGMGFHIIIPYKYFPKHLSFKSTEKDNIYKLYYNIAKKFSEYYSEQIDLTIYDSRRICKIPYSLSIYGKDKAFACMPFEDEKNFREFELRDYGFNDDNVVQFQDDVLFNPQGNIDKLLGYLDI